MGRVYARWQGDPPEVAAAIEEHYRPWLRSGAAGNRGWASGRRDKMDTLCAASARLIPTATATATPCADRASASCRFCGRGSRAALSDWWKKA